MPLAQVAGGDLHYRIDGRDDAPWMLLSNSLGTDLSMWEPQMPMLSRRYRVLRYDTRGHGRSDVFAAPRGIGDYGKDAIGLLDALAIDRVAFCGLSMGGLIGMWIAIHAPRRIGSLALCNTGAQIGTAEIWNARIAQVRTEGVAAIGAAVIERWFTPAFVARDPGAVARIRALLDRTPGEGYVRACEAIRDADLRSELGHITAPTLVIAGIHDQATPPASGRLIATSIAGAAYRELDAAHLSNIEAAAAFDAAIADFFGRV